MISYRTVHKPRRQRAAAVVTAISGVLALCLALGFGAAAVGAAFVSDFGIVALVCGFCGFCFFFVAVMLLRRANEQWGWRE